MDLALTYEEGHVRLKDVAERQGISRKYLGHLIAPLKRAGLVSASRGAYGGYRLARAPDRISLGEVIRAVEGDLELVECVGAPHACDRVTSCVTRDIWALLSQKVIQLLDSIDLQDLVDRHRDKHLQKGLMWNI